jgi:hypothetical protein
MQSFMNLLFFMEVKKKKAIKKSWQNSAASHIKRDAIGKFSQILTLTKTTK